MQQIWRSVGAPVLAALVLSLVGCKTCPPPCPEIPEPQKLSPEVVLYLEKEAEDHFGGEAPDKLIEGLYKEGSDAVFRHEPLAMREVYDRIVSTISALEGPDGAPLEEYEEWVDGLVELRSELHDALLEEVIDRVLTVHKVCFGAASVKENLSEWQAGSFYLGLLPEARTAEEAKRYQRLYTSHEQVKEKIKSQGRIRYSKWAVRRMKAFVQDFRRAKRGLNDDENAMIAAGIEHLGPIVTDGLTSEASQLYSSLIQDVFGEMKPSQRTRLIEGIENTKKNHPYGNPYAYDREANRASEKSP